MPSNLDRYKNDLDALISQGNLLASAIQNETLPKEFQKHCLEKLGSKKAVDDYLKTLPVFIFAYQAWYSEALSVIKLLMPNRLMDFIRLFEKPKNRKKIDFGNYAIEDYLQGLTVRATFSDEGVDGEAAVPQFQQQLSILESVKRRFDSSLFDIKQLVQADLFDSELDAARELVKSKFYRAAGMIAGVVLEKHLGQVCDNHNITTSRNPTISTYNDMLKQNNIFDTAQWRVIQHLGDLRNKCGHAKGPEPSELDARDLIEGVDKVAKTIF